MNIIRSLNVKLLQAPIGSCCTPELAAAVSNHGGLGALALTWKSAEQVKQIIQATQKLTNRAFQANFVLCFQVEAQLQSAIQSRVPVITFSWGIPSPLMVNSIVDAKIPFGVQVFSISEAKRAKDLGADFLITQGIEAGGHVQGTLPLIHQVEILKTSNINLPLVAAGGIGTPDDAIKVLSSGAEAVMIGTRFVASTESAAHDNYKKLLLSSFPTDTVLTECFSVGWPDAPHRVLRNSTLELWEQKSDLPKFSGAITAEGTPIPILSDTPPVRGTTGDIEKMCLYAGTSVSGVTRIVSAAEIIEEFRSTLM